jgi:hypothetical protein
MKLVFPPKRRSVSKALALSIAGVAIAAPCCGEEGVKRPVAEETNPYAQFKKSFPKEASFFPIGVWMQNPRQAGRYKELGVNFYIALWGGATPEAMASLREHDMMLICDLDSSTQERLLDDPLVVGWMHGDEPDLAQHFPRDVLKGPGGKELIKKHWPEIYDKLDLGNNDYDGWGLGMHPINDTLADYRKWKRIDDRPILVQLSKAVALKGKFHGRGDRDGQTWEYPLYIQASDIVSYDIYPVADGYAEQLYLVADGLDALKKWGAGDRPLNVCIEAGFGDKEMANEHQQRAQIWMAINHGADSFIWFVHRWRSIDGKKVLVSTQMPLDEPEIGNAIKNINSELHSLASVINSPERNDIASADGVELDLGARQHGNATYVFAVERGGQPVTATINLKGIASGTAHVINEDRTVDVRGGKIVDSFAAWGTHLYRIVE